MNRRHQLRRSWPRIKARAREQWGELTARDVELIDGNRQVLISRIQERYGRDLATAEREVDAWLESMEESSTAG